MRNIIAVLMLDIGKVAQWWQFRFVVSDAIMDTMAVIH